MFKRLLYLALVSTTFYGCCTQTNTYESFTDEQKQLLFYLNGQEIVYDINNVDSQSLKVTDRYIGNLPPDEVEESNCDSYYPAFGKVTIKGLGDTSINFQISIKKSNNETGVAKRVKWMGYDFNLEDTSRVFFHDSLFLRGASEFNNVYEISVDDTSNTRSDLIYKVFFSTDYGIIRFDRKGNKTYRLRVR
jgi:hypothetical protein